MKLVFDSIIKLKIRTFFIITESEKKEKRQFQEFSKILVNNLEQIKQNYPQEIFYKIFGKELNKSIIPIFSKDKEHYGTITEAFGLDELFKELYKLYNYFLPKKINYDKKYFFDEKKLNEIIAENELLKIFQSKGKLIEDLRLKIKIEFDKALMKLFLTAPKYLYNFTKESVYEILKVIVEHGFNLFIYYLDQKSSLEKYKFLKQLGNFDNKEMIKVLINDETLKAFENMMQNEKFIDKVNDKIPWYIKFLFPIISPVYYLLGAPIIKMFSGKIADFFMDEVIKIDDAFYAIYFHQLVFELNKAIDSLGQISDHFNKMYAGKRFENEFVKIFFEEELDTRYFNNFKKVSADLWIKGIKGFDLFNKIKEIYEANISTISCNEEKNRIDEYLKKICLIIKKMVETKINVNTIDEFKFEFRDKYGILKRDMPDNILEELMKKNQYVENRVIKEVLKVIKK